MAGYFTDSTSMSGIAADVSTNDASDEDNSVEGVYVSLELSSSYSDRQIITGFYAKPACHTSIGVSASWPIEVLLLTTSDRLPLSHPTKMEEPHLLGLISVAY